MKKKKIIFLIKKIVLQREKEIFVVWFRKLKILSGSSEIWGSRLEYWPSFFLRVWLSALASPRVEGLYPYALNTTLFRAMHASWCGCSLASASDTIFSKVSIRMRPICKKSTKTKSNRYTVNLENGIPLPRYSSCSCSARVTAFLIFLSSSPLSYSVTFSFWCSLKKDISLCWNFIQM